VHRRNLEALAARLTGEFVVDANQMVAQLEELGAIGLVGIGRHPVLPRAAHPAHLVVVRALAPGARIAPVPLFGPFVEEGAFVESHRAILTGRSRRRGRV
jgi:hypothetical protein